WCNRRLVLSYGLFCKISPMSVLAFFKVLFAIASQAIAIIFLVFTSDFLVRVVEFGSWYVQVASGEINRAAAVFQGFILAHIHAQIFGAKRFQVFLAYLRFAFLTTPWYFALILFRVSGNARIAEVAFYPFTLLCYVLFRIIGRIAGKLLFPCPVLAGFWRMLLLIGFHCLLFLD